MACWSPLGRLTVQTSPRRFNVLLMKAIRLESGANRGLRIATSGLESASTILLSLTPGSSASHKAPSRTKAMPLVGDQLKKVALAMSISDEPGFSRDVT